MSLLRNKKQLKIFTRALASLALFFTISAYPFAAMAATTTTPASSGSSSAFASGLICSPDNSGQGSGLNIPNCINNIYIFAVGFVGFMAVLVVVFAGYLYMSGGSENITKAKEYISGAIAALIILFSTYAILNTINPNLTNLNSIILPDVNCGASGPSQCALEKLNITIQNNNVVTGGNNGSNGITNATTGQPPTAQAQTDAQGLLSDPNVKYSSSAQCTDNGVPNTPKVSMQAAANGQPSIYDGPNSLCNQGTVALYQDMLDELQNLADEKNLSYQIDSLTGDHHSNTTDPHYQGKAVDLKPLGNNNEMDYINDLYNGGANQVAVECDMNGHHVYNVIAANGQDNTGCPGKSGYHIHAEWQ